MRYDTIKSVRYFKNVTDEKTLQKCRKNVAVPVPVHALPLVKMQNTTVSSESVFVNALYLKWKKTNFKDKFMIYYKCVHAITWDWWSNWIAW